MIPVITSEQMREIEADALTNGFSTGDLMFAAATSIADWLRTNVSQAGVTAPKAVGLVGPGNNGGDALCVLALLSQYGWAVQAVMLGRSELGELPVDSDLLAQVEIVGQLEDVDGSTVILDGIYGSGGRAELDDEAREIAVATNRLRFETGCSVVAIDLPSGLDTSTGETDQDVILADVTLCIGYPKVGLTREPGATAAGEIEVIDVAGIDGENLETPFRMMNLRCARDLIPKRLASAHKHSVGGVLIVGGAPHYYGAPRLAGEAALRAGAGYVGLAVPRSIVSAIASTVPELVFHPLSDGDGRRAAEVVGKVLGGEDLRYSAVVLGPGIGRDKVATEFLNTLFHPHVSEPVEASIQSPFGIPRSGSWEEESDDFHLGVRTLVIDADALHWLAQQEDWKEVLSGKQAVLTPHAGELAKLLGVDVEDVSADPVRHAIDAARDSGQVVVLKSGFSCAVSPEGDVVLSPRAMPELATPGTGDVLSGLIGALLAQGLDRLDAAKLALFLGAGAGKQCRQARGTHAVIARDLIEEIGYAIRDATMPSLWTRR